MEKTYEVDVKAFITVTLKADSEEDARKKADKIVNEDLTPSVDLKARIVAETGVEFSCGGFEVDGTSDVQDVSGE